MCDKCGCGSTSLICPECGGQVVLINNRPVCLSCGASPSPGGDLPEQGGHHHHHHEHEHTHVEKATSDDLAKLRILLSHWIEHNEEHAERFREWAEKAREMGLEEVAQRIEEAVKHIATCNEALSEALKVLELRSPRSLTRAETGRR